SRQKKRERHMDEQSNRENLVNPLRAILRTISQQLDGPTNFHQSRILRDFRAAPTAIDPIQRGRHIEQFATDFQEISVENLRSGSGSHVKITLLSYLPR